MSQGMEGPISNPNKDPLLEELLEAARSRMCSPDLSVYSRIQNSLK